MGIAEREAENAGPECAFQRLRLDMDDVRDAYIAGRTAEPCKEQVEAVARMLFEEPWRKGELAMTFDEYVEARRGFEDEHAAKYMSVARMLLEAAWKAVM